MKAWWKHSGSAEESNSSHGSSMLAGVVFGWTLLLMPPSMAQNGPDCPNGNLTECAQYKKLVEDIDNGDPPTQLASLKAASQDLDPSLRSLIYGKALKSSDLRLRTAAIRYVISGKRSLAVELELPAHPTPGQQKLYQRHPPLRMTNIKVNDTGDDITASVNGRNAQGNIVRGGFEIGFAHCQLRLSAGKEEALSGLYRCSGGADGVVELGATLYLS